jgi:flagellar basal body-associated protein FliL
MSARFPPRVPKSVIEAAKSKSLKLMLATYFGAILGIAMLYFMVICFSQNTGPVTLISTPEPTSNVEYRVQQIELQLTEVKEKQQELQQELQTGIKKVESQYKSWVKPFENLFSASQKEYVERYRKRNEG